MWNTFKNDKEALTCYEKTTTSLEFSKSEFKMKDFSKCYDSLDEVEKLITELKIYLETNKNF